MKRIYKNALLMLMVGSIASLAFGQEKKNEQKVKVVIDEGSGQKTILDTTFAAGTMPETINLKDGKVIFIGEPGKNVTEIKSGPGEKQVFVTVKTDDDGKKGEEKKVIIMSSDSVNWTAESPDNSKRMYVYSNSTGKGGTVIVTGKGNKETEWKDINGDKVIIIKDGDNNKENEKSVTVHYSKNDSDKDTEMTTKYIVAKDGIVVTVESNDEARAKELINEIEKKLGVNNESPDKKEKNKTETNKTVKK